jgi:hypothetical protein
MTELATPGGAQPVRCEIADGLDDHAPGTQPCGRVNLVAYRGVRVES